MSFKEYALIHFCQTNCDDDDLKYVYFPLTITRIDIYVKVEQNIQEKKYCNIEWY